MFKILKIMASKEETQDKAHLILYKDMIIVDPRLRITRMMIDLEMYKETLCYLQ
jgi:hypothetical protein